MRQARRATDDFQNGRAAMPTFSGSKQISDFIWSVEPLEPDRGLLT